MKEFDREEVLSILTDAGPALAKSATIPGLDHYWFDGEYVYAYDGGLGIRVPLKSDLDCGLPGKVLLDLLKTSALKQVGITVEKDDVALKLGKSTVNLASLGSDRCGWPEAWAPVTKLVLKSEEYVSSLTLTEAVLDAITRVSFIRPPSDKSIHPQVVHKGVTIIPQKDALEFYATDSTSIARMSLDEKFEKDLIKFLIPWACVDTLLKLVEPGATLHLLTDCLIIESKDVLICSNLLELPDEPNLPGVIGLHLRDDEDVVAELPPGLQSVLDRAVILAGVADTFVQFTTDGKLLVVEGKYPLGSLDEELPLKVKMSEVSAEFPAPALRRALGQAKVFLLSQKAIVLDDDGGGFVYLLSAHQKPAAKEKPRKRAAAADDGDAGEEEAGESERQPVARRRGREAPKEEPALRRRAGRRGDDEPF